MLKNPDLPTLKKVDKSPEMTSFEATSEPIEISDEANARIYDENRQIKEPESVPPEYHNELVLSIITTSPRRLRRRSPESRWNPRKIIENLDRFTGLTLSVEELARQMIGHLNAELVLANLDKFTDSTFTQDKLVGVLIKSGHGEILTRNIHRFNNLTISQDQIILDLLASKQIVSVLRNYDNFRDLSFTQDDLILKLIRSGNVKTVVFYFSEFKNLTLSHDRIAQEFIANGYAEFLVTNLNIFKELRDKVASDLLAYGFEEEVAFNLELFTGLSNETAIYLMDQGHIDMVASDIFSFCKLGDVAATRLIENNTAHAVTDDLEIFSELTLSHDHLAEKLISTGQKSALVPCIDKLNNLTIISQNQLLLDCIDNNQAYEVVNNFKKFTQLTLSDDEVVKRIISTGQISTLEYNINHFKELSSEVAQKLVANRYLNTTVVPNLDNFVDLGDDVLKTIISLGDIGLVIDKLDKFTGLTLTHDQIAWNIIILSSINDLEYCLQYLYGLGDKVALELITSKNSHLLVKFFDHFSELTLTHDQIAEELVISGDFDLLLNSLNIFTNLTSSNNQLVEDALFAGQVESVVNNLPKLSGLGDDAASILIENDQAASVSKNLKSFTLLGIENILRLSIAPTNLLSYFDEHQALITPIHERLKDITERTFLFTDEVVKIYLKEDADWRQLDETSGLGTNVRDNINLIILRHTMAQSLIDAGFDPIQLLKFANRPNLSRHDAFLAGNDLTKLFKQTGLTCEKFAQQILFQVTKDDSNYRDGTAHHHLNFMVNRGIPRLSELKKAVDDLASDPESVEGQALKDEAVRLLTDFQTEDDIYTSWRTLKAYFNKVDLIVNGKERLKMIARLRREGRDDLLNYYDAIARSNVVDSSALNEFILNPDSFFDRKASHTPTDLHDAKKPNNYCRIPHLDLSPVELRDALVEGVIDKITALPPMQVIYEIVPTGQFHQAALKKLPLAERAKLYLGSHRQKIEGLAINSGQLFGKLKNALIGGSVQAFIAGEYLPDESSATEIGNILSEAALDPTKVKAVGERYVVSIHPKSSPEGVLAGNDTACCMPFGDGKQVLYMMNPICAQFTIQKEREGTDGAVKRTLIQSVMTLNLPMEHYSVPELTSKLRNAHKNLSEILPEEDFLTSKLPRMVADNAESSHNFRNSTDADDLAKMLYADFFAKYLAKLNSTESLVSSDSVEIGKNFSDVLSDLPKVPNQTVPMAPLSYSDNVADVSYALKPKLDLTGRLHTVSLIDDGTSSAYKPKTGISALGYLDTLPSAYLESKAYKDAPSLLEGMHNMENGLIAKDINNAAKNRPELSYKYIDRDGKMKAYMFAYEGKWPNNEECVYISDLASDKEGGSSPGFVLQAFCEAYKAGYLDLGKPLPIYAEMRETTSFALLQKHQPLLERWLGCQLKWEDLKTNQSGAEVLHTVRLVPAVSV